MLVWWDIEIIPLTTVKHQKGFATRYASVPEAVNVLLSQKSCHKYPLCQLVVLFATLEQV